MDDREQEFTAFVDEHSGALIRSAYLLTGDIEQAKDLLQETLVRVFLAWSRIRDKRAVSAYARTTMARQFISSRRLFKNSRETAVDAVPDPPIDRNSSTEDNDALFHALKVLTPQERSAVVLRHYVDMTGRQVAEAMGCSEGAVKAYTSRGLSKLRQSLDLGHEPTQKEGCHETA